MKRLLLAALMWTIFCTVSEAQPATMAWQEAAGGGATAIGTGLLAARGLSSPYARLNARAKVRMASQADPTSIVPARPDALGEYSHAKTKHGEDAVGAWADTANLADPHVHEAKCADGKIKRWNDTNNAFSAMGPSGEPVTSFYYGNKESLERALVRDGCIEPTQEAWRKLAGHDNVRQIPGRPYVLMTTQAGPVAKSTPPPNLIAQTMARRRAEGGRCSGGK